jgi:hypothetical protein
LNTSGVKQGRNITFEMSKKIEIKFLVIQPLKLQEKMHFNNNLFRANLTKLVIVIYK